jgi:hypothetical protein
MKSVNRSSLGVLAAILLATIPATNALASPSVFPKGVTISEPGVTPGVVIFESQDIILAANVAGDVIHTWTAPPPYEKLEFARPLENGNILTKATGGGVLNPDAIMELDLAGNPVFQFALPQGVRFHHDYEKLANGNYLLLCSKDFFDLAISDQMITDDCLMEVTANGTIVWEWQTADHYDDFGFTQDKKDKIFNSGNDWAHANSVSAIPFNTSHTDPRFRPGNIVVSYRHLNVVAIVDRDTGEIVWTSENLTIGQHNAHMISDDKVGGGNILIFDNGFGSRYNNGGAEVSRYYSRVVEVDPVTTAVVWIYVAEDKKMFFSHFISSAQRLSNGNTLITEGSWGRIFEVNPNLETVWEAVSPEGRIYRSYKVSRPIP